MPMFKCTYYGYVKWVGHGEISVIYTLVIAYKIVPLERGIRKTHNIRGLWYIHKKDP